MGFLKIQLQFIQPKGVGKKQAVLKYMPPPKVLPISMQRRKRLSFSTLSMLSGIFLETLCIGDQGAVKRNDNGGLTAKVCPWSLYTALRQECWPMGIRPEADLNLKPSKSGNTPAPSSMTHFVPSAP